MQRHFDGEKRMAFITGIKKQVLAATVLGAMALGGSAALAQEDTIKVGILHSLSGTMAISETTLKDVC
jgi:urea transport system substrate-binding protein